MFFYYLCLIYIRTVHNVVYEHSKIHTPSTLEEIIQIVKESNENGRKLRVLGSGHSWSPLTVSPGMLLSLVNYKGLVAIDTENSLVTVKAGTTLREMTVLLREKGYALRYVPSVSTQTVAGAIQTGV